MILKNTVFAQRQPFVALLLLITAACTSKPGKPDSGTMNPLPDGGVAVSREAVVTASADCAITSAKEFREAALAMKTATAALMTAGDAAALTAAREAFHTAADAWQVNDVMQFGPAAPSTVPGGNDVRDQINPWPLTGRCAVEEQLVSKSYENGVRNLLVNRRGFPALEYLLFYEGTDTVCPSTSPIVSQGTWAALSASDRTTRRYAYAAAVASDIHAWSGELVDQWENGFRTTFTTAGSSNAVFSTPQAALNVVSDAAFYVDSSIINQKLSPPMGLAGCGTPPCLDLLESQFAGRSKRNIAQNLVGFRRLMQGCSADFSGVGFDDLLRGVGDATTADQLAAGSEGIAAALTAIEESDLKPALTADFASVEGLLNAIRAVSREMKTDFLTTLDLELPKTLEGDND